MRTVRITRAQLHHRQLAAAAVACLALASGCTATSTPVDTARSAVTTQVAVPATETPEPEASDMPATPPVTLTIVYDNNPPTRETPDTDPSLRTGWGFACLVERGETALLFDTGGDASTLRRNFRALDIDPADIDVLVLSHDHSDHTGGLAAVLDAGGEPTAFVPASFSTRTKARVAKRAKVIEVNGPTEVAEGVRTTGEMGEEIVEQSLVVETAAGLAVITGCAHPGIVKIVKAVAGTGDVGLVMGGFHLRDEGTAACAAIAGKIEDLGVARVAPTHCTGDTARSAFADAYGNDYVPAGVGTVIKIAE